MRSLFGSTTYCFFGLSTLTMPSGLYVDVSLCQGQVLWVAIYTGYISSLAGD